MMIKQNKWALNNTLIGVALGALAYHLWMTRGGISGPFVPR